MSRITLNVVGISSSQTQSGGYALILSENEGQRRLPIIIGVFEAQAIAIYIERMKPPRPLTHDLFKTFALAHQIIIKEVVISRFHEGVFYAEIHSIDAQGNVLVTDARTSDAVALALRFSCPIYTTEEVLSQAGITMDQEPIEGESPDPDHLEDESEAEVFGDITTLSLDELQRMLDDAVAAENYELASQLRDEINRREEEDDQG